MKIREHHPLEPVTEAHFVIEVSMSELKALYSALANLDIVITDNMRATESAEMIELMSERGAAYGGMMGTILEAIHNATGPRIGIR